MRKPVLPRILGLLVVYCAVFIVLVMIQFTKKGNFTQRIGGMVVSGQYSVDGGGDADAAGNGSDISGKMYRLAGGAALNFGGLEFNLRSRESNEAFALVGPGDQRTPALAENINISDDAVSFTLSGGTELIFQTQNQGGAAELWISGIFASGVLGVDIPVKTQRSSLIREAGDGSVNVSYDGTTYQFSRPVQIREKGLLSLQAGAASVSYRAIPERKAFNPANYLIANARGRQSFNDAITRWKDQKFSYWGTAAAAQPDEEMVSAYCSEAVRRGSYREALASIAPAFFESSQRGFLSSSFTGGMNEALRIFIQTERDAMSRILRMLGEKSPNILTEYRIFEFLFIRGNLNNAEEGLELVRSMDPSALTYDICPGIFEGYTDIRQFRPHGDNPFERLIEQACNIISAGIYKDTEKDLVLIFRGNAADIEYNLRAGKALIGWAEAAGKDDWANLGHSLLLSVISMSDNAGAVPASVNRSETGVFSAAPGSRLSAARVYRIISPGEYYPRAVVIGSGVNGLWAWTASASVSAAQENNVLDIGASFPTGETHYMMIRGIRPFEKIQIYNMDYHTDPQFERYDSSGWVYSSQEQILTVKLKHRGQIEHVRIFY